MAKTQAVKLSDRMAKITEGVYALKPRFPVSVQDGKTWVKRTPTFAEVVQRNNLVEAGKTADGKKLLAYLWFRLRDGQAMSWTVEPEKFLAAKTQAQPDAEAVKLAAGLGC